MLRTASETLSPLISGFLYGLGTVIGAAAVIGAIFYMFPNLNEAVWSFLNSCFG